MERHNDYLSPFKFRLDTALRRRVVGSNPAERTIFPNVSSFAFNHEWPRHSGVLLLIALESVVQDFDS